VLARFLQTPTEASGEAIVPTPAAASCLCHVAIAAWVLAEDRAVGRVASSAAGDLPAHAGQSGRRLAARGVLVSMRSGSDAESGSAGWRCWSRTGGAARDLVADIVPASRLAATP
jgi:hypothetical protein